MTHDGEPRAISLYQALRALPEGEWHAALKALSPDRPDLHDIVLGMLGRGTPGLDEDAPTELRAIPHDEKLQQGLERRLPPEYRAVRELGRGGMGVVYLAERVSESSDRRSGRVAIKVLAGNVFTRDVVMAIEQELESLLRLDQLGTVPRVIDYRLDVADGGYIATEYVDGWSLEHFVRDAGAKLSDRLQIFADVVDSIARVHSHGIVHRDIKPSNILIRRQRGPHGWSHVVIDFGLSLDRLRAPSAAFPPAGTIWFMSPEHQTDPKRVGVRSDIYSLGKTLLWLLHEGVPEIIAPLPPFPSAVQTLLGPPGCRMIEGVISRCLMHNPIDRFQSANELVEALGEVKALLTRGPSRSREPTTRRRSLNLDVLGVDRSTREVFREGDCVLLILEANHAAVAALAMRTPSGDWLRLCPGPNDEPLALSRGVRTEYPAQAQRFVIELSMGPGEYTFVGATFSRPGDALDVVRDPRLLGTIETAAGRRKDASSPTPLATITRGISVVARTDRSATG